MPLAIPLALASHFVLDVLPHFGCKTIAERMRHIGLFRAVIMLDSAAAAVTTIWLIREGHVRWLMVGVVAYAPDVLWIYRFIVEEKFGKLKPTKGNRFVQFHRRIQKYERLWGLAIETIYGVLLYGVVR